MNRQDWNPQFVLRWDTAGGPDQIVGTSRDIHDAAPRINQAGDHGEAWDIAVLDEHGVDVTGWFFDHLDQAAS